MSGGRLVVLDRTGQRVKRYPLGSGLATLGSHPRCDIRVMLPSVCEHHATVVVHATQTVVRNVGTGSTLVNGQPVSVAALHHGDIITICERHLRWEYSQPRSARPQSQLHPVLYTAGGETGAGSGRQGRTRRRGSAGGAPTPRSPSLQLALELQHRASTPGSAGGKQVAVVQPQRRDTPQQNGATSPRNSSQGMIERNSEAQEGRSVRGATKAWIWIESRKTSPRAAKCNAWPSSARKAPPLREAAMRRAASLTKLQHSPLDQTKQAAIMLMTGHTPKSKLSTSQARRTPSFLVKKPSPVATPRGSNNLSSGGNTSTRKASARKSSSRNRGASSVSVLEISDSSPSPSTPSARSSRTSQQSRGDFYGVGKKGGLKSPPLPTPKKSAMKDPKKSSRKTESIKFDLSNLENCSQLSDELTNKSQRTLPEGGFTLFHDTSSDVSILSSPSPRISHHSPSSRILDKSLGASVKESPAIRSARSTFTIQSPPPSRKTSRGSVIIQKALESINESGRSSRRSTKTVTDRSLETTVGSAYRTNILSPRSPRNNLETYSIVDLVSMESNETKKTSSVYDSAGSADSSPAAFKTPDNTSVRKTRSTIDRALVDSSTPYVRKVTRKSLAKPRSNPDLSDRRYVPGNESRTSVPTSGSSRRSKSTTTPENTLKHISVNSTRISRSSRKRSRINDTDSILISDNSHVEDESPRSSKKSLSKSSRQLKRSTGKVSPNVQRKSTRRSGGSPPTAVTQTEGMSTPEQRHSPEEVGTPVLSIQSLLDSSQSSLASLNSNKKSRVSVNVKRKTIGAIRLEAKGRHTGWKSKSKSLSFTARRGLLRLSKDSSDKEEAQADEKMVTPKSAVKLVQEAVKNKHSTAKKPQSKRSIIDNLDESDIVKQLFNSPVKRKLSQSMTEFSRKQLFDDEEMDTVRRPTRNTVALTGRTPDRSVIDNTDVYTPERFVSPMGSTNSPDLTGIDRLFRKNSPNNDLSDIRGVKSLLRSPRTRKSVRNDLTDVYGVKRVFAKSPKNRLSDVAVKEVFTAQPKDDLRRVSGVKSLFRSQKNKSPRNDLTDVRGVKKLFQRNSPVNDLRRVSGVKRTLRRYSPRNDLRDVRGVKRMYGEANRKDDLNDLSGVEELFNESFPARNTDRTFDQLLGKPPIKAVYSKSFLKKTSVKPKTRKAKSLHVSYDMITNNVEEWLEQELQKRLHRDNDEKKNRELQKLVTDTVEGISPLRESRVRRSVATKLVEDRMSAGNNCSSHALPLKKRSLAERDSSRPITGDGDMKGDHNHANGQESLLPLKKRMIHSTPKKGPLYRPVITTISVSPIPTPDAQVTYISSSEQQPKEQLGVSKSKRVTRQKQAIEIHPKNTRAKMQVEKDNVQAVPPTKLQAEEKLSKNTRQKNQAKEDKIPSAPESKNTRARNTRAKKPADDKTTTAPKVQEPVKDIRTKINRGRKITVQTEIPPVPTPKQTRGRVQTVGQKSQPKESAKKARTRKAAAEKPNQSPPKRTRAKVQNAVVVVSKPSPQLKPRGKAEAATRISRKTTANVTETKRQKVEPPKQAKNAPVVVEIKRGRRTRNVEEKEDKAQTKPDAEPKRTRSRSLKKQESTQSEPTTTRGRPNLTNIHNTVLPEVRGRKRKSDVEPEVPNKKLKSTGKSSSEEAGKINARNAGRAKAAVPVQESNTRSKRTAAGDSKPPVATKNNKNASEPAAAKTTRKRNAEMAASPAKASPQKELVTRVTRARSAAAKPSTKTTSRTAWR